MKRSFVVLSVMILALAATAGLASQEPVIDPPSQALVGSSETGSGDLGEALAPLASSSEPSLQSQEPGQCPAPAVAPPQGQAKFTCNEGGCCNYVRDGDCCVPLTPDGCGRIRCAGYCSI